MKRGINSVELQILEEVCKDSLSKSEVLRKLGIPPNSGNLTTLTKRIKSLNIDISHFTGRAWNVGARFKTFAVKKFTFSEIFCENSEYRGRNQVLKKMLINEGIVEEQCSSCGLGQIWNGKPIVLQLDHIDGNNLNNSISNLRILCPNCHSQTETFAGKKKKNSSALFERKEVEYRKFREAESQTGDNCNPEPSVPNIDDGIVQCAETLHGTPKFKSCRECNNRRYNILEMVKRKSNGQQ